jgi:hypothetical protein
MSLPARTFFVNPRFWLLAGLLLLPFMLTNDSIWLDEGDTAMYAMQPDFHSWREHLRQSLDSNCLMPLPMFFAWIGGRMLGTQEWQMRAVNLLWGVFAVAGMFRAGRRLQLPWLPLLLASQPYFWFYMNEARPYAVQIACGAWLLAAFVEFHTRKASGESWAWLLATAAFFLFLSTMLAPLPVAAAVIACGVAAVRERWKPSRKAVFILLGGAAANIPTAIYYYFALLRGAHGAKLWHVDLKFFGFVLYELTGMTGLGLPTEEIRVLARSPHFLSVLAAHWFQFALPALGFVLVLAVMILGLRRRPSGVPSGMSAGLVLVLGMTALVFIAGSLALQKAFWARHFAPVFPFYVTLLGLAFAGMKDSRKPAAAWIPFLLCGLLALSALNLRLTPVWRKEDYRSAAQFARRALAENKSVWWVAGGYCATYYHLECAVSHPEPGKAFRPTTDEVKSLQPPDVIIYSSKPDIHDPDSAIQKIIEQKNYKVAVRLKSFIIWIKPGELPENHSAPGAGG